MFLLLPGVSVSLPFFNPTSKGYLKWDNSFLMRRCMYFSMIPKTAGGHPDKILVTWDISLYEVGHEGSRL